MKVHTSENDKQIEHFDIKYVLCLSLTIGLPFLNTG